MVALKFCDVQPRKAIEARRRSPQDILLDAIGHQIALLKDQNYTVSRVRYRKTDADGYERAAVAKPPRKWWFLGDDKTFYCQLHLGSSTLVELEKGKPSIACGKSEKEVIVVLEQVATLIREGKFTDAISEAHGKMKRKKAA